MTESLNTKTQNTKHKTTNPVIKDQANLEYAISQYLDGTLSEFDRRVLEDRLAVDAEARLLASEYAHLDTMLRASRAEPTVDYDRFASHLSGLIEQEESYVAQPIKMPGAWMRYTAVAAALILAIGIGLHFISAPRVDEKVAAGSIDVKVEFAEKPASVPSMTIAVGPSDQLKQAGYAQGLLDDSIIMRTPKLVISAADQPTAFDDRLY